MAEEYIEREDAIRSIADHDEFKGERWIKEAWADYLLEDAKPADVAPVVRCKDCKYWNKHSQYGYDSENGVYGNYCMIWTPEDDFYAVETPEDGFCYKGKRKDNESVDG